MESFRFPCPQASQSPLLTFFSSHTTSCTIGANTTVEKVPYRPLCIHVHPHHEHPHTVQLTRLTAAAHHTVMYGSPNQRCIPVQRIALRDARITRPVFAAAEAAPASDKKDARCATNSSGFYPFQIGYCSVFMFLGSAWRESGEWLLYSRTGTGRALR
ncbi:hypothetical protein BS78_01G473200 [Paspalum vaginatum]|nr:hypothetical protein BS78_01G473200 [Paspalum vaginatum]